MAVETRDDSVPIPLPTRAKERTRGSDTGHWPWLAVSFPAESQMDHTRPSRGGCAREPQTRQVGVRRQEMPARDSCMLAVLRPADQFYPVHTWRPPEAGRRSQHPLTGDPWSACQP